MVQSVLVSPGSPRSMTVAGEPGSAVWLWVGPTVFDGEGVYDYLLFLDIDVVVVEQRSWSEVKGLFD